MANDVQRGYYLNSPPSWGGTGSMAGPAGTVTQPLRVKGWTPTVATLAILIVLEIAAYALLRWAFRTAHGG